MCLSYSCGRMHNYQVRIQATGNNAVLTNVHVTYHTDKRVKMIDRVIPNSNTFEKSYSSLRRRDFSVFGEARLNSPTPAAATTTTTTSTPNTTTITTIHNLGTTAVQPIAIDITILRDGIVVEHETERSLTGFVSDQADTDGD